MLLHNAYNMDHQQEVDPRNYTFFEIGFFIKNNQKWPDNVMRGRLFTQHWYILHNKFRHQKFKDIPVQSIGMVISPECSADECNHYGIAFLKDYEQFSTQANSELNAYKSSKHHYEQCSILSCSRSFIKHQAKMIQHSIVPWSLRSEQQELLDQLSKETDYLN